MPNDVEAMCKCSRAVGAAEVTDSRAFMSHVANERVFDLIPELKK